MFILSTTRRHAAFTSSSDDGARCLDALPACATFVIIEQMMRARRLNQDGAAVRYRLRLLWQRKEDLLTEPGAFRPTVGGGRGVEDVD